jgi:hypothetical protein
MPVAAICVAIIADLVGSGALEDVVRVSAVENENKKDFPYTMILRNDDVMKQKKQSSTDETS